MQDENQECVVCRGLSGALCRTYSLNGRDGLGFSCGACGDYEVSRTALLTWFRNSNLDALQRAALSHRIRVADNASARPFLTTDWLEHFVADARLPNPVLQAANLLRVVGDHQSETGEGYFVDGVRDAPLVGSFDQTMFSNLLHEVITRSWVMQVGSVVQRPNPHGTGVLSGALFGLTLDGWEQYEKERRGKISGKYGFIAMKFGDEKLENFVSSTIKPELRAALGYDVVDLRNVSRAGVIDNILREQIRDAAFVLVDLTHDNSGAYWEAGYAEGLGKPVVYLCERQKFEQAKTHFDTNHCTTVMWSVGDEARFVQEIVATLRRTLNLF